MTSYLNLTKKMIRIAAVAVVLIFAAIPAQAGMVGTAEMTSSVNTGLSNAEIATQRSWIQQQLEANGVPANNAALRVSSLSDSQIQQIHQRIDEMPAGAGVLGVIAFGFLVLVITDLTGLTDVFPFIRPQN